MQAAHLSNACTCMVFAEDHSLLKVSPLLRGDLHEVLQVDHSAPRANFNRYSLATILRCKKENARAFRWRRKRPRSVRTKYTSRVSPVTTRSSAAGLAVSSSNRDPPEPANRITQRGFALCQNHRPGLTQACKCSQTPAQRVQPSASDGRSRHAPATALTQPSTRSFKRKTRARQ